MSFRKYLWVAHLVAIAACSFFAAQTVATYLSALLGGTAKIQVHRPLEKDRVVKEVPEKEDFEPIVARNVFNSAQMAPEEGAGAAVDGSGDQVVDPNAVAVKTGLPIKILGLLAVGNGEDRRSSATISGGTGGGTDVYFVGDTEKRFAEGAKLVRVAKDRIEFTNGGRLEYAELEDVKVALSILRGPGEVHGKGEGGPAEPGGAPRPDTVAVDEGKGRYTVDQREIDEALGNLDKLYTEVRIVPNFKGGKPAGLKVLSIKPGSLFSKLGIQRGDVLEKINGMEMDIKRGMELFGQLKDSKNLTIDIERKGQNKTLEYEIR
ncbi:MAG: type II secretion system protein GspC [Deltaproteobacteria bacterium]|nr:type II secretion system protein GspC [Deltaproteobacteria bacterium]